MRRNKLILLLTGGVAAGLGAVLAGCTQTARKPAEAKAPEIAPGAAPTDSLPLSTERAHTRNLTPPPQTAIELLLKEVEAALLVGEQSYKDGQLAKARGEFDRALDMILTSGIDLQADPRLEELFNRVVETVHAREVAASAESETFSEPRDEPAPIDEIAEMALPADLRLREEVEREIRAVPHDLPLVVNEQVLSYVNFFQTPRGRAIVERGLARAGRYQEMISRVLREEGLPQDLIYLAQAESAFQPLAVSRARARGIWQFMASRAREYGLQITWWTDERQDPEKSTRAAARHLKDLYEEFGDWHLVLAAYNSGPGNVARAIERTGYADFWELHKRNVLPRETKNYVPIILALSIIAKDPEKHGILVQREAPIEVEQVKPGAGIDLRLVAETIDVSVESLKQLNPHLLRRVTPNDPEFELYLPAGTAEQFLAEMAAIPRQHWTAWRRHRVQEGETLSSIAKQYKVTVTAVAEANGIARDEALRAGEKLVIPAAPTPSQGNLVRYRVRRGDTLDSIAQQFDVTVQELKRWNGIRGSHVARGAVLKVYPGGLPPGKPRTATGGRDSNPAKTSTTAPAAASKNGQVIHEVKRGETLWSIARAYQTTVEALRAANRFLLSRQLQVGDQLVILVGP